MTLMFNYMNTLSIGSLLLFSWWTSSVRDFPHALNGVLVRPIEENTMFFTNEVR